MKEHIKRSKFELKTERLTLRPIRLGDEEAIHEYAGDKGITMMFFLPNETFEETCDFVRENVAEWDSPDQTDFEFVILYDGKIIGGCDADLSHSEDRSYATLGWIINKEYRNRGFASEAAHALLDYAFENLDIEKAYAQCDINNPTSYKVMMNIGMTCVNDKGTRTYPRTGKTSGEYTCLITREEWESGNQMYKKEKDGREYITKKQYEDLFLEMNPGYFARDYVRAVPVNEPASEMLLCLWDFDEERYDKSFGEEISFGYYHGDMDKLKENVAKVVPHWVNYFNEDSKVYCGFIDGEVASFCQIEDFGVHMIGGMRWRIGGPGCVGTLPEFRNKGIGLSMVKEVTKILKEEKYDYSYIHYTYETEWYGKLGYETFVRWNGKGFIV